MASIDVGVPSPEILSAVTLSAISQRRNLAIAAFGALFCLIPLFALDNVKSYSTDDVVVFQHVTGALLQRSPSLLASFFVVLIPAADLLLDLPPYMATRLCPDEKLNKKSVEIPVVVHLNDLERLMFIFGVCIQSCVWFLSSSSDLTTLGLVYFSTTNASVLLVLGPILTYLQRCTITFTTARASVIVIVASIGLVIITIANFFRYNNRLYRVVSYTGSAILGIPGLIFAVLIFRCAYKFCRRKLSTPANRQALRSALISIVRRQNKNHKLNGNDIELYTNYIPGLHMLSCIIIIIANSYVLWSDSTDMDCVAAAYERKNFIVILAEIVVLVIELRIRKNEIARGLIALLECKKSYVRHISHELRTPLNTAFLGLKLLSSEMKASEDPKDVERYDTLCDVNLSCMAAVDILNDLLCFEKLESGILELHNECILIEPFLKNCIAMFNVQARECGVSLEIDMDIADRGQVGGSNPTYHTRLPLQPDDTIHADKFKMDQVIRNLISNALKFTPRGGYVTIKAFFTPEPPNDAVRSAAGTPSPTHLGAHGRVRSLNQEISQFVSRRNPGAVANCPESGFSTSYSAEPLFGKLVIVVSDTGAGINEANQKRLFNEIVQFNPEKLQAGGGSGLGLWITRGIVDLHEGHISVFSEGEGTGSSFTIEMPMLQWPLNAISPEGPGPGSTFVPPPIPGGFSAQEIEVNVGAAPTFARHRSFHTSSKTSVTKEFTESRKPPTSTQSQDVLVVDDSRLNRKMLLKFLRSNGFNCVEAVDGLEALHMVKARIDYDNGGRGRPYDVILMDFIMPLLDGPGATQAIRDLGYTAPVFGVTGNGLPSDVEYFLSCGADRVLLKPLDIEVFGQALREMEL